MTGTIFKPAQERMIGGDDEDHAEMLTEYSDYLTYEELVTALQWYKMQDYEKSAAETKRILRQRAQN